MPLPDPLSESITRLTQIVIHVAKTTANFKPQLSQLQRTLDIIAPIIKDVVNYNNILDRPKEQSEIFLKEIGDGERLVEKCLKIKWYNLKRYTHSLRLNDVNNKLLRFFQLEVQADQSRDIKQTLVEVSDVNQRMNSLSLDMSHIKQTLSSNSLSVSSRRIGGYESTTNRRKLGWRVPVRPVLMVGFDEPLKKLKAKVLEDISDVYDDLNGNLMDIDDLNGNLMDIDDDRTYESSIVDVAAAGGCGKTTLAIRLCHDSEIRGKFGENIFFVTVSETPNFMVIVNDLINPDSSPIQFQSDEDAKHRLRNFLLENVSGPMLLVLDDVWSDTFIDNFSLNIKGYKILVTSRTAFPKYDVFEFDPLSDEHAKILFSSSAFTTNKKRLTPTINEDLVNQMVKCCKKHPLTLTVVGSSLKGRDEPEWRSMLKTLSQGSLVLDLNEVRNCLERSFTTLDKKLKECYMDFGLFPEDQRIPASALLDMWVHLYNHDNEGLDTFNKIVGLSFRNLVTLVATRKDSVATTVNYCDQQFVTQHDLLRELAIHLSSKPEVPIALRKRLIISAQGKVLPVSVMQVREPMQACILSVSTGESFSSEWCDIKVPKLEVMVLNLKSKTYTLPHFIEETQNLKILNVTNDGVHPTYIENFHLIGCLSNLLRIRLERVAIPSLTPSILALKNLQKVSFIMCNVGNTFKTELGNDNLKVWPGLVELEMDYCQDLEEFPGLLCSSIHLKTLSITNCNDMCEISEEFGKLTNLEKVSFRCCTKLKKLPGSITRLQELNILDISDCLYLSELPTEMGKLGGLRTIYMKGCTGIEELPSSVEELSNTDVFCSEELYHQWQEFGNVKAHLVEENRLETLFKFM